MGTAMDEDQHPIPKSPAGGESQWLLDVAAGRPIDLARPITESDLELAVRHGLIGVMTDSANQNLRRAALPIFARLKARQKVMEHNLARILSSLHEAHIPATILKGPHLARWAYRNPDHRTYTDIDLLVPAEHVEATLEVLAADAAVSSIPPGSASTSICTGISSATPNCEDVQTAQPTGHGNTPGWFPIISSVPYGSCRMRQGSLSWAPTRYSTIDFG
jgi:hypothetical protein